MFFVPIKMARNIIFIILFFMNFFHLNDVSSLIDEKNTFQVNVTTQVNLRSSMTDYLCNIERKVIYV